MPKNTAIIESMIRLSTVLEIASLILVVSEKRERISPLLRVPKKPMGK